MIDRGEGPDLFAGDAGGLFGGWLAFADAAVGSEITCVWPTIRTPVRAGWKPTPERGGGVDHRMAYAASKAIHRRFILRWIPTTAALKWFCDQGGEV